MIIHGCKLSSSDMLRGQTCTPLLQQNISRININLLRLRTGAAFFELATALTNWCFRLASVSMIWNVRLQKSAQLSICVWWHINSLIVSYQLWYAKKIIDLEWENHAKILNAFKWKSDRDKIRSFSCLFR